jgi:hypothetical protein
MACEREVGGHTGSHGRLTRILVRMMAKRVDVVATLSCPPGPQLSLFIYNSWHFSGFF